MANDGSSMQSDQYFAEMLEMMRTQGGKDNPTTLQLGVMQSANSVKIDDLILYAEDLYIADYLVSGYSRRLNTSYLSGVRVETNKEDGFVTSVEAIPSSQSSAVFTDGLKKGDLVAVQRLHNTNKYVILARVVSA